VAAKRAGARQERSIKEGGGNLDVQARTPSMRSPCLPALPEDHGAQERCHQPKQHVGQQHPDRVLHAQDPLVVVAALCILGNEHLPEDAKRDQVAQKEERIDVEEEPRLDQRQHEDERRRGPQRAADHGPHPLAVDVFPDLARAVHVGGIQPDDGDAEHELEEAKENAREAGDGEARPEGGAQCGFFALERATREEWESHGEESWSTCWRLRDGGDPAAAFLWRALASGWWFGRGNVIVHCDPFPPWNGNTPEPCRGPSFTNLRGASSWR